jgi:small subunit ribosomal protein S16
MLMIRLQRIGRKNDPAFRMVVTEKTASVSAGKYVDLIGTYNPKTKAFTVDAARVKEWVAKGAQLSPSLNNLLVNKGIIEGKKLPIIKKSTLEKNKAKAEEAAASAAAAAAAPAPVEEAATPVAEDAPAPAEEVAAAPEEETAPAAA